MNIFILSHIQAHRFKSESSFLVNGIIKNQQQKIQLTIIW